MHESSQTQQVHHLCTCLVYPGKICQKKSTTFIVKLDKQNKVLALAQSSSKHANNEVNRGDCMCIDSPKNLEQNK